MSKSNCCGDQENCCSEESSTCCGETESWVCGEITTTEGEIPVVSARLIFKDTLGTWKVRWGIGRMNYKISPGLYVVGNPDTTSLVLVSANYKLTFDKLRKEIDGLNVWLLILDTKGVNVWCAAGKGTFGTDELVSHISETGLSKIVLSGALILPQLSATGVSAHEVKRQTGFLVIYGPVRARDIKDFIAGGFKATREMRTVEFTTWDRLVLTPVELLGAIKTSLYVFGVLFLLNLFAVRQFGLYDFIAYAGSALVGTVITPVLLPIIPGRAFSWKGWLLGLCWTAWLLCFSKGFVSGSPLLSIGYLLLMPSVSAYFAINFTGSSTYTSFSGVIKEMKTAIPLMACSSFLGSALILITHFIK
jgi:hypothetical protein